MNRRVLRIAVPASVLAGAIGLAACGTEGIDVEPRYEEGAVLFAEHCGGCHTLKQAGTEGSSENVRDFERTDGPNLNKRKEQVPQVLYAMRNGGFSGAIMPQNIVTGQQAQAIAEFVAKYAGSEAQQEQEPSGQPPPGF
jgi:mono/diheme cytochrome c family protein